MKKLFNFKNLIQLLETFKTEQDCIDYLIQTKHNGKTTCPFKNCIANEFDDKNNKIYAFKDGKTFKCKCCKKRFSIRVGTIFEDSNIPLKKWFIAIYLLATHKRGIASCQLAKDISVTQKTAWFILQRLRHASQTNCFKSQFTGVVEADETYVGGKAENMHSKQRIVLREKDNKTIVLGMVNRDTKQVKSIKVDSAEYHNLGREIMKNIKTGSTLITDGHTSYITLNKFYNHKSVNHSEYEYVRNEKTNNSKESFKIHTNTMEGYWGIVKRTILGTYYWVSNKHIDRYLSEIDMRYNNREMDTNEQFDFMVSNLSGKLSYKSLIS